MKRLLLLLTLLACSEQRAAPVEIYAASSLPPGVIAAAFDLEADLRAMGADAFRASGPASCEPGEVHIALAGEVDSSLSEQELAIDDERCEDGRLITLSGGGPLSRQWAAYALLETLGVRYFHPEQTYHPRRLVWPERDLSRRERPWIQKRTFNAHRTHPIELSPPLDHDHLDMAGYQRRWIDWAVKTRHTRVNGFDHELVGAYAYDRGFGRTTGINLLNAQQGGRPLLDPDDPRSEEEQISAGIEERMKARPGLPDPVDFSFQFNPSEFTEADDEDTVRRIAFIADYMRANHPDVELETINHGTHGGPTRTFGVRFYDLPQFAPTNLAVRVHPLMFYDLGERPAPVYGNEDFSHMGRWLREQAAVRRVIHYPESSWWLTFDLPVPLYLAPVALEARQHDLDLFEDLIVDDPKSPTGLVGHRLFSSGQEWGYWLIDYCVTQMTWSREVSHADCIGDFTSLMVHGDRVRDVLLAVERRQVDDMRDPELIRFLVGSDDETELAWEAGIRFHPLPPRPIDVVDWTDEQIRGLEQNSLVELREMAADYHGWASELAALMRFQDRASAPWLSEVHDGIEVFALRAEHAATVYETVIRLREARDAGDLLEINAAFEGVDRSRALTEEARTIVRRREAAYRYPESLTIAEGDTRTVYPYRYLARTNQLFYWSRPDDQLAELFGEGLDVVDVLRRIVPTSTRAVVRFTAEDLISLRVDWGDGTIETGTITPHAYEGEGFYDFVLDGEFAGGIIHHEDRFAVVDRRFTFPRSSLDIVDPESASLIEPLLPGFSIGLGNDGEPFLALGRIDDPGSERATNGTLQRRARSGNTSGPADLRITLRNLGDVTVVGATLDVVEDDPPRLQIRGQMRTQEIIDLLVTSGSVDEEGALELVASVLEYTPETLPDLVDFSIEANGR